jgi:hypothetical protein
MPPLVTGTALLLWAAAAMAQSAIGARRANLTLSYGMEVSGASEESPAPELMKSYVWLKVTSKALTTFERRS